MAHNFQTGNNKIKLLTEYESVAQKVLLPIKLILQNINKLLKEFYFVVSGLKIIGHGIPDSNLESHCISFCSVEIILRAT
jgi:hypothetical protein